MITPKKLRKFPSDANADNRFVYLQQMLNGDRLKPVRDRIDVLKSRADTMQGWIESIADKRARNLIAAERASVLLSIADLRTGISADLSEEENETINSMPECIVGRCEAAGRIIRLRKKE